MPFSCKAILDAFMEHDECGSDLSSDDKPDSGSAGSVTITHRCSKAPGGGYYRVWGPNAPTRGPNSSYIVVESHNGVVGVHEKLVPFVAGLVERRSDVNITHHELGYGCAPEYGNYSKAIPTTEMGPGRTYPTPADLVQAIIAGFGKAGVPW